ncbi:hypothetical protein Pan181_08550 [Aeoliella mucimassa]|uniref:Uncharacterized protein n=1 Tax=Aeoliella mucimassa TaxID=2527972 RepID=A0A518AIW7_9BACT|nr:hypothetical protein Pan181_08550 [Aeoliella mucimassa]
MHRQPQPRSGEGFATFEIFVISPILLVVGAVTTFFIRTMASTSHWSTWTPQVVLGIPFLVAYGWITPLAIFRGASSYLREKLSRTS